MSTSDWYAHKAIGDGVYWIQERFYESGNRANIWLVRGSHQDLVIDTGLGLRNLPDYLCAQGLLPHGREGGAGRRPLMAVATHVHFDHAGGLHQFEQVAVHREEAEALTRGDNFEAVTWLSDSEVVKPPSPGWSASQFRVQAVKPTHVLEEALLFGNKVSQTAAQSEVGHFNSPTKQNIGQSIGSLGDIISLGDRQLTVMHMPGHSRGSICLHDRDRKILFSGDVAYDGSMIDWLPYSNIPDYVRSCERLKELVDRGLVEKVLPGHFNTFGAERLHRLACNYISNAGVCHKVSTCALRSVAGLALRLTNSRRTT